MTVYPMTKRYSHNLQAYSLMFLSLLVSIYFVVPFLYMLIVNGIPRIEELPNLVGAFVVVAFVTIFCWVTGSMGWRRLNLLPYEICVYDSGIVEFKRRLDSVTIRATEIHTLIEKQKQGTDEGTHFVVRELRIQHPYGSDITLGDFIWLDDFVAHLLSLNPAIIVEGLWTY